MCCVMACTFMDTLQNAVLLQAFANAGYGVNLAICYLTQAYW